MPWCPRCKNEYKIGYTVCADCGLKLLENIGNELVAYYGTEDEIDNIVDFLESKNTDYVYKRYNSKEDMYELMIQENQKEEIRELMKEYFTKIKALETPSVENNDSFQEYEEEDEPIVRKRYKKPEDRAAEYKSGYQTMLLVGIIGLVGLVLIDIGVIPITFPKESTILINVVMGGMFLAFLIIGVASFKTYKKLSAQTDIDNKLEEDITEWFEKSVTVDIITSKENKKEAEEILYFNRFKRIKKLINNNFGDLDPAFVEYVADKLYNNMFK